jgi:hypothetical protein
MPDFLVKRDDLRDVAGDVEVRRAVHSHYGDELVHSMAVGVTHWEDFGAVRDAYLDVIEGRVAPNRAHVLTLPT